MRKTPLKKKAKAKSQSWYRKKCVIEAKRIALTRDSYTCQRCNRSREQGAVIHGSHVYPEGTYHGLSANPDNIKALCYLCHFQWWHKHPTEAGAWFIGKFPERHEKLKILSRQIIKTDWKQELERLKIL